MGRRSEYRQFTFGLFAIFIILFGFMGKELISQEKKNKADVERYEKMVNEEGKFKLTQKILDEDHEQYVKDGEHGAEVFKFVISAFGGAFILILILSFMRALDVKKLFPPKYANIIMWIMLAGCGVMVVFGINFFTRVNAMSKRSEEIAKIGYKFYEMNVESRRVEKKEEYERDADGHTRTITNYYYYLTLEGNKEIQVKKLFYDRAEEPGLYYCGATEKGNIFSMYPATEFELGE